jgi:hypothetical protein
VGRASCEALCPVNGNNLLTSKQAKRQSLENNVGQSEVSQ